MTQEIEQNIQSYLYNNIPITEAMGIGVTLATPQKVILFAPFANNINHKQTVFGGSLHAVATLACWSLLYLHLKEINEINAQLVITESHANYLAPVDDDFTAECVSPGQDELDRFLKVLKIKRKSRIALSATIQHQGRLALTFQATFAAIQII